MHGSKVVKVVLGLVRSALAFAITSLLFLTLCSYLGSFFWAFELLSHFRVQFAALSIAAFLGIIVFRTGRNSLVGALLLLVMNSLPVLSHYGNGIDIVTPVATKHYFKLITLNAAGPNVDLSKLETVLYKEMPHIVVMTEVQKVSLQIISTLKHKFPFVQSTGSDGVFGILVLSRVPIKSFTVHQPLGATFPVVDLSLCIRGDDEACVNVIALHPILPATPNLAIKRNVLLNFAADLAREKKDEHTLLVGDLNITPWSPMFERLLDQSRLHDSSHDELSSTWVSSNPWFGLTLDHVLYGGGFVLRSRRVGPDIGSDHFPVIVDFGFNSSGEITKFP